MEKQFYLTISGTKVKVTEEVYRAYKQPIRREKKRAQRKWRCRDGKGIRCKGNCEQCDVARFGGGATGNDLSLEELIINEASELMDPADILDEICERERSREILEVYDSLNDDQKRIVDLLVDGWTQKKIAEEMGISISAIHQRVLVIRKQFKKITV